MSVGLECYKIHRLEITPLAPQCHHPSFSSCLYVAFGLKHGASAGKKTDRESKLKGIKRVSWSKGEGNSNVVTKMPTSISASGPLILSSAVDGGVEGIAK